MIFEKSKSKNTKKNRKGARNIRIPYVLRTLQFLNFFELFKTFGDFIWLGYCLNRFITLRKWSNDRRKNQNARILKN